jgi:hypothetical protein
VRLGEPAFVRRHIRAQLSASDKRSELTARFKKEWADYDALLAESAIDQAVYDEFMAESKTNFKTAMAALIGQ